MIKKVAVFGQTYSVNAKKEISILLTALEKHNVVVFFEENFYKVIKNLGHLSKKHPTFKSFHDLNSSFDLFFSLGGDGTILRAITYIRDLNIPILGINTGRLGFLANIQKNAIEESIDL
ncbi:MAG: NAD(+) kinase, partial [Flavobacterium sp.]|nr:NAD(+) kinase [Flavobacterium sp.]